MWAQVVAIAFFGALGALCRWGVNSLVGAYAGNFPWATLAVNFLGCVGFGLVWSLGETRLGVSATMRAAILVGFLGAFTTFSAFAADVGTLLQAGRYVAAASYVALQNGFGVLGFFAGLRLGGGLP